MVDLWQADNKGDYDNSGYRLRGHQRADADGRYRFRTIVPGSLSGPHAPFPREGRAARPAGCSRPSSISPASRSNARDPMFRRELLIRTAKNEGSLAGRFDFVLDLG